MFYAIRQFLSALLQALQHRRNQRRQLLLQDLQIVEQQRQWQRSFEQTSHDAELAAGYDQPHFNVME
jgi:hypothetical protein